MVGTAPLHEKCNYYGENDFKPLSSFKRLCIWSALILLSPLIFILFFLSLVLTVCFVKLGNNQIQSAKALYFDYWFKAPGKKLAVVSSDNDVFDIVLASEDFVDGKGCLHFSGGLGVSLRKSVEHTVDQHLREGLYGAKIASDTDLDNPRYLLNGSIYAYDPTYDELWCSSGRMCHWPALYSWSPRLPAGMGFSSITQKNNMNDLPDVLGYIYFFEVSNPEFYETDRIIKVGQAINCPTITPENEGKLFVRYNYGEAYGFGNIKKSEPDAYIFKGKTLKDAEMKLRLTYRIMKPETA